MADQSVLIVIAALAVVAVVAVAGYFIARGMKGKLELALAEQSLVSGQTMNATLTLTTKKGIEADRLYAALIAERQVRGSTSSSGSGSSTKWVEFYREEFELAIDERFPPGARKVYDLRIAVPTREQVLAPREEGLRQLQNAFGDTGNPIAAGIAKGIGALASGNDMLTGGKQRWKVVARLETKGVDLAASERVHVSLNRDS